MLSLRREEGQGVTEYALILVFVVIFIIVALHVLGRVLSDRFITIVSSVINPTPFYISKTEHPDWCEPAFNPIASNLSLEGGVILAFPEDCAKLKYKNTFTGTASNLSEDVDIWVLLFSHKVHLYYPQSNNALAGPPVEPVNGEWSVTAYLGLPNSGPEVFDVVVILANSEASSFFSETVKGWAAANDYIGLGQTELPDGIVEVGNVTVKRVQ